MNTLYIAPFKPSHILKVPLWVERGITFYLYNTIIEIYPSPIISGWPLVSSLNYDRSTDQPTDRRTDRPTNRRTWGFKGEFPPYNRWWPASGVFFAGARRERFKVQGTAEAATTLHYLVDYLTSAPPIGAVMCNFPLFLGKLWQTYDNRPTDQPAGMRDHREFTLPKSGDFCLSATCFILPKTVLSQFCPFRQYNMIIRRRQRIASKSKIFHREGEREHNMTKTIFWLPCISIYQEKNCPALFNPLKLETTTVCPSSVQTSVDVSKLAVGILLLILRALVFVYFVTTWLK